MSLFELESLLFQVTIYTEKPLKTKSNVCFGPEIRVHLWLIYIMQCIWRFGAQLEGLAHNRRVWNTIIGFGAQSEGLEHN